MKQFDLQGNEYDIQIKEMLDNIPKDIKGVYFYYTEKGLLEGFKEEALRHREEIEHLQHDLESEQEKTSKLAKRIHHALGYIEGAVEVDINYVCRILLGKEDD